MSSVYQICVSGAAKGESVEQGKQLAKEVGVAIAKAGHSLMTGATTGLPEVAADSYIRAGGKVSFGISPAGTKVEHVLKYRLPTEYYDVILYSGLHYVSIGGRIGTLHEFTIAMETRTPVALLQGAGGVSTEIADLIKTLPNMHPEMVVIDTDPDKLIAKLTALLDKLHAPYRKIYNS
jgi:uncharacterized protein (TIGR00725 family)